MNGELLTAGEIKQRATYALRSFWGAPAVRNSRRVLLGMPVVGLVEVHEMAVGGVRWAPAYQTTGPGERRLREWVAEGAADEAVVPRSPLLLRIFLGREIPV